MTGLVLLDLRFCRSDSEVIAADKNLPEVAAWLSDAGERVWLDAFLTAEQRETRIREMEQYAVEQQWDHLTCLLAGWHDDLQTMQLLYARWDADILGRNARKKGRERARHWRVLADDLWERDPDATQVVLFYGVPWVNEKEDPKIIYDGNVAYEFWMEEEGGKDQIVCKLPSDLTDSIQFEGFKKHLRERRPAKIGGG